MPDVAHGESQEKRKTVMDDRSNDIPAILSNTKMKLKIDTRTRFYERAGGEDRPVGGKRSKGAWCKPRPKWMMGGLAV